MADVETEVVQVSTIPTPEQSNEAKADAGEDTSPKAHDNSVVSFIDILGRVSPLSFALCIYTHPSFDSSWRASSNIHLIAETSSPRQMASRGSAG